MTYPGTCKEIKWTPTPNTTPSNTGGGSWTSKNAGGTWVAALDQNNSSTAVKSDCFDVDLSGYICTGTYQVRMADCKGETVGWNTSTLTLLSNNDETSGNGMPDPKSTIKIVAPKECTLSKLYFDGCNTYRPVISCAALSSSKVKGSDVIINPVATKCDNTTKCSYTITGAGTNINHTTKDWTSGNSMQKLATVNEEGEKTYKLKVANVYEESAECEFTINYTAEAAGNLEREIVNNQYPQDTTVASGTCFDLTGTWTNQYDLKTPSFACNAVSPYRQIRITYGDNTWDAWDYTKVSLGVQLWYTTTKTTFISGVCAYSIDGGTQVKCKFEN